MSFNLPPVVFRLLLVLAALVALAGLFVPLMDNDAAHHAVISMRMYLTGDYVNLIDQGRDYLDKPHLHFWLSALSFEVFGISAFAYKLPSFLFAFVGVYAAFRFAALLYDRETGRLAALMLAVSFGFLLSVSDVRMDALLVSFIAFSLWQMLALAKTGRWIYSAGAALGLAAGFATKGHIAVFIPATFIFLYLLQKKELRRLLTIQWISIVFLFLLFISPVLYCYYLQFNLHPEKSVRGETGINGVKFILWDQVWDRMSGKMEEGSNGDPFFFFHSFLPAFAPWSVLAYIAVADRLRSFGKKGVEMAGSLLFLVVCILVSISSYQLPHYLNILFPSTAALTAAFVIHHIPTGKWLNAFSLLQGFVSLLVLLAAAILNAWAFPVSSIGVLVSTILLLALVFYFAKSRNYNSRQRPILVSASAMIFFFFLMNLNFYPRLLQFQAGEAIGLAFYKQHKGEEVWVWENTYSSSFHLHSRSFRQQFQDNVLRVRREVWLLFDRREQEVIEQRYSIQDPVYAARDFEVTRLTLRFLDPKTRKDECNELVLARIRLK